MVAHATRHHSVSQVQNIVVTSLDPAGFDSVIGGSFNFVNGECNDDKIEKELMVNSNSNNKNHNKPSV